MKNYFLLLFLVLTFSALKVSPLYSQFNNEVECFSIATGKFANIDSTVFLCHNEDDWGDLLINWYKVPEKNHTANEKIKLQYGAEIPQVPHTFSYLWIEMPGLKFSDSYMNQWGVTVASDQCRSREDNALIINGGIGYYLRRIMVERAKTAKQAVKIAGKLIDSLGYNYSGRTYCVSDPDESWLMAVVKGKHWVAQRVPDDEIAVIANCYTIDKINLSDTSNFLGSKDIVDYAISRGWFDLSSGKEFSFKYSYAAQGTVDAIWNKPRAMAAINALAKNKINYGDNFPFSFKPRKGIAKKDLMRVLASHLEGTDFESCNNKNPHENIASRVCSPGNQYGFVAELRKNIPAEIANVMWIAIKRPCTQAYIPWYSGIENIPQSFTYQNWESALENHFSREELKEKTKDKAYWKYKELADITDKDYYGLTGILKQHKKIAERRLLQNQNKFESEFIKLYKNDKSKALELLDEYEKTVINESLNAASNALELLK